MAEKLLAAVAVVVMIVVWTLLFKGWHDCNDRGGSYVRGAFWYVCIDAKTEGK